MTVPELAGPEVTEISSVKSPDIIRLSDTMLEMTEPVALSRLPYKEEATGSLDLAVICLDVPDSKRENPGAHAVELKRASYELDKSVLLWLSE